MANAKTKSKRTKKALPKTERPRTPSYEALKAEFQKKLPRRRLLAMARPNQPAKGEQA